jgi:hypothetical protein
MHSFQRQHSAQTLAEGIAEYCQANPGLVTARHSSVAAQEFFRCHDAVHVVFGCGTTLSDEAIVKVSSVCGTSGGFGVLHGHRLHESRHIYRTLARAEILSTALHSLILVPRTLVRCLRQRRRWPWKDFDRYLNVSLYAIRQEFGIRVAHDNRGRSDA